jgi:hypothetical protein
MAVAPEASAYFTTPSVDLRILTRQEIQELSFTLLNARMPSRILETWVK